MQTLLPYLLKAAVCLAVFWIFYRVMLSRTTLYRFNRLVLLAGTTLAMLLPLCVITRYREIPAMPELPQVVYAAPAPAAPASSLSWQAVVAVLRQGEGGGDGAYPVGQSAYGDQGNHVKGSF